MGKKIHYRATDVQQISVERVLKGLPGATVLVGVDVAKRNFTAALCDAAGQSQVRVRFEHPRQSAHFLELLEGLQAHGRAVQVAMEPTGTYGDPLRFQLDALKIPVFRVSNKHVHDAAELFDGSPSKHDSKDCSLIGWLHAHGRSKPWNLLQPERRCVRALVTQRDLYDEPLRRTIAQMEPLLARHFPEFESLFDLSRRKTPYRLLQDLGSPAAIAECGVEPLSALLKRYARRTPKHGLVQALLHAARTTSGAAIVDEEIELVRRMAAQVLLFMRMRDEVDARIARVTNEIEVVHAMRPCLGAVSAAVLFAYLGDPRDYSSAAALEKAAGLNLVESSSGTDPNSADDVPRHISKRGAAVVRKYLFLAAMRLVQSDPLAKAWYQARKSFKAENKIKALVASIPTSSSTLGGSNSPNLSRRSHELSPTSSPRPQARQRFDG